MTTIHEGLGTAALLLALPLGFLIAILIATAIYAFKVGQSGSRIHVTIEDDLVPGITDVDDDQYWKAGIFYVNKSDPSFSLKKGSASAGLSILGILLATSFYLYRLY